MPDELPETIVPEVSTLFARQVAADNTSMVPNGTWVPQVCLFFFLLFLLFLFSFFLFCC